MMIEKGAAMAMEKTVQDNLRELGSRFAPALKNASKNVGDLKQKVGSFVRDNPGKALIGAATAGLVTALIARRFS